MKRVFCLMLLLAATAAIPASADTIYRWVDDEGVTHFTAQPPKNRPSTRVRTQTGHSTPVDYSNFRSDANGDSENNGAESDSVREFDDERCAIAQRNLRTLEVGGRIAIEENGQQRFLNEEEIQAQTEQARAIIDEAC